MSEPERYDDLDRGDLVWGFLMGSVWLIFIALVVAFCAAMGHDVLAEMGHDIGYLGTSVVGVTGLAVALVAGVATAYAISLLYWRVYWFAVGRGWLDGS